MANESKLEAPYVVIIDYGIGNVGAIANMITRLGKRAVISNDREVIFGSRWLVLPGVGSFDAGMDNLESRNLLPILHQAVVEQKKPTLGICLGMQLFARKSEEGKKPGLGWIDAEVVRFVPTKMPKDLKIPHMGWNELHRISPTPLLKQTEPHSRYYFVHSYHLECRRSQDIAATCHYGYDFAAVIQSGNIFGTQFHPEKSHRFGASILSGFLDETAC